MLETVLASARKIADANRPEAGRVVSLAQLRADPQVQVHVNSPARVIDLMGQLADAGLVRMVSRHPEPRWFVSAISQP